MVDAADVGILSADAADDDSSATNDDDSEFSCRWDVFSSLHYANYTGSCCASDKADGSALTPALPTTLGLRITGVGDIPLPISDGHAKALKSNANTQKINDDFYHNIYSVQSRRIRIKNPEWEESLAKLVKCVAFKLGVDPDHLVAELNTLLYFEKGSALIDVSMRMPAKIQLVPFLSSCHPHSLGEKSAFSTMMGTTTQGKTRMTQISTWERLPAMLRSLVILCATTMTANTISPRS